MGLFVWYMNQAKVFTKINIIMIINTGIVEWFEWNVFVKTYVYRRCSQVSDELFFFIGEIFTDPLLRIHTYTFTNTHTDYAEHMYVLLSFLLLFFFNHVEPHNVMTHPWWPGVNLLEIYGNGTCVFVFVHVHACVCEYAWVHMCVHVCVCNRSLTLNPDRACAKAMFDETHTHTN